MQTRNRSLAIGLKGAGIPAPADVDWDLVINGRVSDKRCIMVWYKGDRSVALVEDSNGLYENLEYVVAVHDIDLKEISSKLKRFLF